MRGGHDGGVKVGQDHEREVCTGQDTEKGHHQEDVDQGQGKGQDIGQDQGTDHRKGHDKYEISQDQGHQNQGREKEGNRDQGQG